MVLLKVEHLHAHVRAPLGSWLEVMGRMGDGTGKSWKGLTQGHRYAGTILIRAVREDLGGIDGACVNGNVSDTAGDQADR